MLHANIQGDGPPLVLLHGLFGSFENLGMLARPLSKRFKVYSVDLPNHGRSPRSASMSLTLMAEQLAAFLESHDIKTPQVIGHSLGAKVVMEAALSSTSSLFKQLILLDMAPVAYKPHHHEIIDALLKIDLSQHASRKTVDIELAKSIQGVATRQFLLRSLFKNDDNVFEWRFNLAAISEHYPQLLKANRLPISKALTTPTLFLSGNQSDYVSPLMIPEIESRFSDYQFADVLAGHWLHAEKTADVLSLIEAFLR